MPTVFFPLTIITQQFEDETALAEALNFHEISRFATNPERLVQDIRANVEEALKKADGRELQTRLAPKNVATSEVLLELEAPRNSDIWREAVAVKFHVLQWTREDGYCQAFVPALKIAIVSKDAEEMPAKIEKEIRAALARTKAARSLRDLRWLERVKDVSLQEAELAATVKTPKQRAIDEDKEEEEKSVLEIVGNRLDQINLPKAYEVEPAVELLGNALTGKQAKSVLLVGDAGVGKTAIFNELVRRRAEFNLKDTPFWATSGARLVAGQTGFGMWQERAQKVVKEAKKQHAILHLGNLVELMEAGKSQSSEQGIANFLRPKIARGELQVVCECTPEQLPVIERRAANLLSAFQQIRVEEPNRETGLKILQSIAKEFAQPSAAEARKAEEAAIRTLDAVHRRYATYSAFPGRPVRFLRNLFANLKNDEPLDSALVLQAFSQETGLPLFLLSDAEKLDLAKTEEFFAQKVLGQTEAVKLVTDLIATVKARLTRPRKPIASLLFIGATGVGKTELTKALAEFFFRDKNRMIRFDMSEFSTPFAVQRLIGGAGDGEGQLTAKMREQPFSVLLFDEFEKAHPAFFDLLLQVLGEGRLTDSNGRVADFTNAIIVMTSNLGAEGFQRGKSGFLQNSREKTAALKHFNAAVRDFLRPEIYNRIDRIVPFAPLDEKTARRITELELEKLKKRDGLRFRQVKLDVAPEVLKYLAEKGYDPRYGARPLRRTIERELLAPLAEELNQFAPETKLEIAVSLQNERLGFAVESDISQKKRATVGFAFASQANRAADLRRKTQKLQASHHLIELDDERFQLVKMKERMERGRWVAPEEAERLNRLPKIRRFLDAVKDFGETAAQLEDEILLDIYGKAAEINPKFAAELDANDKELKKILFELLWLKTEKPDEICLAIFSENPQALFRLSRCYLYCAEESKAETSEIICFTTVEQQGDNPLEKELLGRKVWRQTVADAEKFFAGTNRETVGIVIKIEGEMANPRFASESGVHAFALENQIDKVLVIAGDFNLPKMTVNEQLETRGSIDNQTRRRTYDATTKQIEDYRLGKKFDFDGRVIAPATNAAIEEHLQKLAARLLE